MARVCRFSRPLPVLLCAAVAAATFARAGKCEPKQSAGGKDVVVEHVQVKSKKPFAEVVAAFESQVGTFDAAAYEHLKNGDEPAAVRARIERMVGPSGFMLFRTSDHGALLRLVGQKRKAIQYLVGNPLIAIEMTRHDIRASLYAPLRVLLYEDEQGATCVEYDRPSSQFGQFGNAKVTEVATMLDRKLEQLIARAIQ